MDTLKYIAAISWTMMVVIGSSVSGSKVKSFALVDFVGVDKVMHLVAYTFIVLLWSVALKSRGNRIGGARLAFYSSIALGLLLEFGQYLFFQDRSFEIADIIANITGSIIGLIFFYKFF